MKKRGLFASIIFLITLIGVIIGCIILNFNINKFNDNKETIKVAFYENHPCYYLNKNLKPYGYYNELLKIIAKKLNFNYEYVNCEATETLQKLKSGQVDLVFGIVKTKEREKEFEFTDQYINNDNFAIYTNKNLKIGNLKALNGLKMAYLKGYQNNQFILEILKNKGINVKLVNVPSYYKAEEYLLNNKVDFIVENTRSNLNIKDKNIKKFFEFSAGPVYIVARKENKKLIENIDSVLGEIQENNRNLGYDVYSKYFNKYLYKLKMEKILIRIFMVIILAYVHTKGKDRINKIKTRRKIKNYMKNDKYLLYYQPIVDPKRNMVKGFETLLRLKKDGKILSPYSFINEIEKNNMSLDLALWILRKVFLGYDKIKDYKSVKGINFYISLNVSFKEIENPKFLKGVMNILKDYDMENYNICLEIVEKFGMEDANKIKNTLSLLKEYGFLIAIDDFGVEYSNLDLLNKIDSDIVKLDKYFADNLNKSILNEKTIEFIVEICKLCNRTIIFEGIEEKYQVDIVKLVQYEKMYIQGYFYSKPVDIETLKDFEVKGD
ncbi:EAL domain-containing protein [Clostridium sp.]|uniref:EAL domain-containing protein n=1 Tax=Clostridium sp. TaxID=1506 RepID=UPI002631A3E8|nr:EAL domain-containing protein [Clostridium sp.]